MIHEQLTRRIIGCAMQVHKTLKSGFQEVIYQRALAIEFRLHNLQLESEQEMEIYYRDKSIGTAPRRLLRRKLGYGRN